MKREVGRRAAPAIAAFDERNALPFIWRNDDAIDDERQKRRANAIRDGDKTDKARFWVR